MYTAPAKGGVFLPHFNVWSARAPCLKERQGDVYSQQSQNPSQPSKACGRNGLSFSKEKKARERVKIKAKDTVEVERKASRATHWKRPSAEEFYHLQNCFCIEQPGILGCRAMWSGNCFQTFRRNAPPHIQGYMSMNSLTFFSHKPRTNGSEWALEKSMRAHSNQGCWLWDRSDC